MDDYNKKKIMSTELILEINYSDVKIHITLWLIQCLV